MSFFSGTEKSLHEDMPSPAPTFNESHVQNSSVSQLSPALVEGGSELHESVLSLSLSNSSLETLNNKPTRSLTIKPHAELSDNSSKTSESNLDGVDISSSREQRQGYGDNEAGLPKKKLRKQKTFAGISYKEFLQLQPSPTCDDKKEVKELHRNATFSVLPAVELTQPSNQRETENLTQIARTNMMPNNSSLACEHEETPVNDSNIRKLHRQATFGGRVAVDKKLGGSNNHQDNNQQLSRQDRRELSRRATFAGLPPPDGANKDNNSNLSLAGSEEQLPPAPVHKEPSVYDNVTSTIEPNKPADTGHITANKTPQNTTKRVEMLELDSATRSSSDIAEKESEQPRQRCVPKWDYETGKLTPNTTFIYTK